MKILHQCWKSDYANYMTCTSASLFTVDCWLHSLLLVHDYDALAFYFRGISLLFCVFDFMVLLSISRLEGGLLSFSVFSFVSCPDWREGEREIF